MFHQTNPELIVLRRLFLLGLLPAVLFAGQTTRRALPDVVPVRVTALKEMVKRDSGKVVLVNVWVTWCKPCKEELPRLARLRKDFSEKELSLILVSADDSEIVDSKVRPSLKTLGVDFPTFVIHEKSDEAFMSGMDSTWNGALPTTFVYARNGKISEIMTGERRYDQFVTTVSKLLKR